MGLELGVALVFEFELALEVELALAVEPDFEPVPASSLSLRECRELLLLRR